MAETANIAMPPTPAADVENAPAGMLRLFLNSDAGDALYTKDENGVVTPVGNNTDPYAPGVPADWNPAPTTDADALDQLGARTSTDLVIGTVASAYANYFTTWAAAYARATLAAATGPVTIWLAEDVTAPADFLGYNLQNRISVRGLPSNPNFPTLTFAPGATVRNWAQVSELALVGSNVVGGGAAVQNFFFRNVEVRNDGSAAAFFSTGGSVAFNVFVSGAQCRFTPGGGSDQPVFNMQGTSALVIQATDNGVHVVSDDAIKGAAGANVQLRPGPGSHFSSAQAFFLGTLTTALLADASRVNYDPTVIADWDPEPVNEQEAFDQLAARALTADQKLAVDAAVPALSEDNPAVGRRSFTSEGLYGIDVLVSVGGPAVQVIPAAPAGFMWCAINMLTLKRSVGNPDTTTAYVEVGIGEVFRQVDANNGAAPAFAYGKAQLTAQTVAGADTGARVTGAWCLIPDEVCVFMRRTAPNTNVGVVDITELTPPAGQIFRPFPNTFALPGPGVVQFWLYNGDTGSVTWLLQLIRAGVTSQIIGGFTTTKTRQAVTLPVLIPGDVVRFSMLTNLAVANSVIIGANVAPLELLT